VPSSAASPARVREESCPVPGCSSGSGLGAGDGGVGAAGQRQDGAAAVLDRRSGLGESAAWVSVGPGETDPQQFWLSVLGALRRTSAGSGLVQAVTAAPGLDGWAIVERLLKDLARWTTGSGW